MIRDVELNERDFEPRPRITPESDGIQVEGYRGYWHVIDWQYIKGRKLFLLEHSSYGDMTEGLIIDENGDLILDEVWNGWEDYTYAEEEGLL